MGTSSASTRKQPCGPGPSTPESQQAEASATTPPRPGSRRQQSGERRAPPEPDWSQLDKIGNYLHQLQEVPDREEPELDCRFEDLQLTPQQLAMAAPPEARLKAYTPVRRGVARRMESQRRINMARQRRAGKPSKWAQKLSQRYKRAWAEAAARKLDAAGTQATSPGPSCQ